MKTYFQNGTMKDIPDFLDESVCFFVQELENPRVERYMYTGDNIKYDIDAELVNLYDKFRDLFFSDTKAYYDELELLPLFVQTAGIDSDCCLSSKQFVELSSEFYKGMPNLYKHIYLNDCQFLVATIQNLLEAMSDCLCDFYVCLSDIELLHGSSFDNTIVTLSSSQSSHLCFLVETYFTKAYSIMDIFCKIAYEFENPMTDFSKCKKMNCANILWGDRKHLKINKQANTIFADIALTKMIESIRNEVVHNGTWEIHPKTFISIQNGEITERFVLFPDFEQDRLATVKNRKHFFSNETKVNDILPKIHKEFMGLVLNTTKYINGLKL